MFSKKETAQGTIEYLVIIAIVVVIALIVTSITITQTSSGTQTTQKSLVLDWASKPIRVTDLAVDSEGNGKIVLTSGSNEKMTITQLSIDGIISSQEELLFLSEQKVLTLSGLDACPTGGREYSIEITYLSENGLEKKVFGNFYATYLSTSTPSLSLQLNFDESESEINASKVLGMFVLTNSLAVNSIDLDDFMQGTESDTNATLNQITLEEE